VDAAAACRLALAAAEGASGKPRQEVRKRLAAIARSSTYVDSRKRKALICELEAQRQPFPERSPRRDPAKASRCWWRFLELGDGVDCDRLLPTARRRDRGVPASGGRGWGQIASAAKLETRRLAEQVVDLLGEQRLWPVRWADPGAKTQTGRARCGCWSATP